jgi:hypothetical protein
MALALWVLDNEAYTQARTYINVFTEYEILIAYPRQKWLRERSLMLLSQIYYLYLLYRSIYEIERRF